MFPFTTSAAYNREARRSAGGLFACLLLLIAALGADTLLVQGDAAQGAAVNLLAGGVLLRGGVDTAGEGELCDIQLQP